MKTIRIAAGILTLTALATLPASSSEEDSLEWTSVTILSPHLREPKSGVRWEGRSPPHRCG
ncbi:MAG: hypothetical protein NTW21_43235 [Verrucomicrobia bacterium]|nr:hypothetical protein [Verrucomicrobiota bacterium]